MASYSIGSVQRALQPLDFRRLFGFLRRGRYQLAGGLTLAVLLPEALWFRFDFSSLQRGNEQNTLFGTAIALIAGAFLLRRVTRYPGVGATAPVIPTFAVAYALVISAFFFLRVDYSRFLFLSSFILAIAWFSLVVIMEKRVLRPRMVLVPFGQAKRLMSHSHAQWRVADSASEIPQDNNAVVADLQSNLSPEWEKFLALSALKGIPVYHWKQIAESLTGRVEIEHLSENSLGSLIPSSIYFRFKRIVDVLIALAALPFAILVAGVIALAIRLEGPGPVLFRQRRLGFRGEIFTMFKFRTMRPQAEAGSQFTTDGDRRITRVGRILRRYRLDELPQIVNIFRGEMSWIGPRPEALSLAIWYESEIPFYAYRHIVRPGISGWAQVNQGNVAEITAATNKLHYDFFYIKYFSFWLDLLIAAKTVRTVLTGFGAR